MLIYDVKKDEFIDVKADSYYWGYEKKDTSDFFKEIVKLYPECDLYIDSWAYFGAGHFIVIIDKKTVKENEWPPCIEVITDYNDKVCNITREHLAQFEQYESIGDDLSMLSDMIDYLNEKEDILHARIFRMESEQDGLPDEISKLKKERDELKAEICNLERERNELGDKYKELRWSIRWD